MAFQRGPESAETVGIAFWRRSAMPTTNAISAAPLAGRVAIVTGSTSGIGLGVARALAAAGADVVINGLGDPVAIAATCLELEAFGTRIAYDGANLLNGLVGDDDLFGRDGDDELFGDVGIDWLQGDEGNDKLRGGGDPDVLLGGEGNDLLIGGNGADLIAGDEGADTVRWEVGDTGVDELLDFSVEEDLLSFQDGFFAWQPTNFSELASLLFADSDADGDAVLFAHTATGWHDIAVFTGVTEADLDAAIADGSLFHVERGTLADDAPDGYASPTRDDEVVLNGRYHQNNLKQIGLAVHADEPIDQLRGAEGGGPEGAWRTGTAFDDAPAGRVYVATDQGVFVPMSPTDQLFF